VQNVLIDKEVALLHIYFIPEALKKLLPSPERGMKKEKRKLR
jgi:hypothetical protein